MACARTRAAVATLLSGFAWGSFLFSSGQALGQCYLAPPVPANLMAGDQFGQSLDFSGNTCAVGSTLPDGADPSDPLCNSGAVWVFEWTGDSWVEKSLVPPPSPACHEGFGKAVAIEDSVLAVSLPLRNMATGSVLVYESVGGQWAHVAEIVASDAMAWSRFGTVLAIDGGRLLVGSPSHPAGAGTGAVYVFERVAGVWMETQKLVAFDGAPGDGFGNAMAIDGDVAILGAVRFNLTGTPGCESGAAYVFEYSSGTWAETQKLTASDAHCSAYFGSDVAIHGDAIAVGSHGADVNCPGSFPDCDTGAVYMFRKQGTWQENQQLLADPPDFAADFGARLAFDGSDRLIVTNDAFGATNQEAVLNYQYSPATGWVQESLFAPPDVQPGDHFGWDVASSGGRVLISSLLSDMAGPSSGRVYHYVNTPPSVGCDSDFIRGDANGDGAKNIADAVFALGHLFPGTAPSTPQCMDALDSNDDGSINIADPVALLAELFGNPSVPLPLPAACGSDPTADGLQCLSSPPCP